MLELLISLILLPFKLVFYILVLPFKILFALSIGVITLIGCIFTIIGIVMAFTVVGIIPGALLGLFGLGLLGIASKKRNA